MIKPKKKFEVWDIVSIVLLVVFILFLVYPLYMLMRRAAVTEAGEFTWQYFQKFFSSSYYTNTIKNSVKVTICVTLSSLLVGIPLSYFYTFYKLKGRRLIFIFSLLCCMSAPFIGAYSWIMLMGRRGVITMFLKNVFHINVGSIYGFGGIMLVQTLKFFPLVFIYMNGAFKNIDNTLMEASANMGCTGVKRLVTVVLRLVMPTTLAASLLVFMRAFADFGTPALLGEGYMTFPILIYREYIGENGTDAGFAAAISVIAVVITAIIFLLQKWINSRFKFSINALHPVEPKDPHGIGGVLMHVYCYLVIAIAFLPQLYIIYMSFRNSTGAVFKEGYSLDNYKKAAQHLLTRSVRNTVLFGVTALALIIVIAIAIAYLVVRRGNVLNHTIDTLSMIPYIMPGIVIGIAMLTAFGREPFRWTGTMLIMIIPLVIRRLPYTIRSSTATLQQIPISVEEAAISLGASKMKSLIKVTVPMMSNGILSGAILSWVAIVTEVSSAIILYNTKTLTLTMSAYIAISRGNYGQATAFSAILTVFTIVSLLVYLAISKSEDVRF